MPDDSLNNGQRTLGVIDGALTQISLAVVLLLPTWLTVLALPSRLTRFIAEPDDAGAGGGLLAPGPFFVIGLLCGLIAISLLLPEGGGALIAMGDSVRTAAGEGQFWRAMSVAIPLLVGALVLGIVFWASAQIWRLGDRSLVAALRTGQYGFAGLTLVIVIAEPSSTLVGPGGENGVFEPFLLGVIASWLSYFHFMISPSAGEPLWKRAGAALSAAGCLAALFTFVFT